MASQSSGSSSSSSTSGSPEITQLAEEFMKLQYQWGQDQFASNTALTNQVIGDMMGLYSQLSGIGGHLMSQYQNMFEPEYRNLVNDANNYASQARIQQAMGAAESGVAQQFNGARNAALADLQSFGIDPSSGRYASLDAAERTQAAAAQAGAGFQAEQATEAVGRGLRSEALQLGSVMPSQATAAYNAAGQSATAAGNLKLANSQEGVNMLGSPVQWGGIGQQGKKSSSQSSQHSNGNDPSKSSSGNNRSGSDNGREGISPSMPNGYGGSGNGSGGPGVGIDMRDDGSGDGEGQGLPSDFGGIPMDAWTQQNTGQPIPDTTGFGGPDFTANNQTSPWPGGDMGDAPNPNDYTDANVMGSGINNFSSDNSLPTDTSGGDGSTDQSSFDTSGDQPFADNSGGDSGYAKGGAIPTSKSPSRGRKVDDVRARVNQTNEPVRLNAGEHVMTRDAVKMKGRKFFDDINKKARGGAIPTSRAYA